MGRGKCEIRIGTSGWHYEHWRGRFYPDSLPKDKWLQFYTNHFGSVEINNTFYQLPKPRSLKRWHDLVPPTFLYAVKANRFITHVRKLKNASESLERFFGSIEILQEKLGPILYQLPPSLRKDLDLLEGFIKLLPKKFFAAFEFREKSWYTAETFELLNKYGLGFCIHDMSGLATGRVVTGDIIYIRFHGATGRYAGNYPDAVLQDWAEWIKQHRKKVRGVYVYFNNDANAYAVYNARTLKEQLLQLTTVG
jgi:uncharacterized protein YecE (DUF72 family)